MMTVDKAELRRLAEAATGGDWEFRLGLIRTMSDSDGYVPVAVSPNCPKYWREQRDKNMQYIAIANPYTVLALLDDCQKSEAERDAAFAELAELKAQLSESRANDRTAMGYLSDLQRIAGGDDFPSLVRNVEGMAKDSYKCYCDIFHRKCYFCLEVGSK